MSELLDSLLASSKGLIKRASTLSLSAAYPPGQFCVPNIILQEQKGTHNICRHLGYFLAVTKNSPDQ